MPIQMGAMGAMGDGAMGAMGAAVPGASDLSPMVVDALISSRGDTVTGAKEAPQTLKLGAIDDAEVMPQWAPFIRQHVLLFDLISALRFEADTTSARLKHVGVSGRSPRLVAEIRRPEVEVFESQARLVETHAELREERAGEILSQLTPQWAFWNAAANLRLDRRPKTMELMGLALSLASFVEMRFKHALACPRPSDYLPSLQPIIPVPLHGSLPSGHATEAFIVVHLLEKLLPHGTRIRDTLQRLAARTSINRTIAGVHFPIDSQAGQLLGQSLGEYLVCLCRRDSAGATAGSWNSRVFIAKDGDFNYVVGNRVEPGKVQADPQPRTKGDPATALGWLWGQARAEWA